MNKVSIIQLYEASGSLMYEATLKGDYKTNNREGEKLLKIFKVFEKDHDLARECIEELLKSRNIVVRSKAAAYCLALNEDVDIGESILEEIAADSKNGIFGFNAKMTLKEWRKNGKLVLYKP